MGPGEADGLGLELISVLFPYATPKHDRCERRSLELVIAKKDRHVVIAGNFNCQDIDWDGLSVQKEAEDKDVQQALFDLSVDFNLI